MAGDGSLKKEVYKKIFQKIINNEFPIDQFLVEGKLADLFGVSRAPVREALVELCHENILKNIPRAGYQIVQISRRDIRDALQIRMILEIEGTRMACDRLTEQNIEVLKGLQKELEQDQEPLTLEKWMKNGTRLHLTLAELSGNGLLYKMVKETHDILRRATVQIFLDGEHPSHPKPSYHLEIVRAMIRRDTEEVVGFLCRDINTLRQFLQEV